MAFWPNRGEEDPRPPQGSPYRRVAPIAPAHPAVPDAAEGALRLPLPLVPLDRLAARSDPATAQPSEPPS